MENKRVTPITKINKSYKLYGLYCPYTDELRYIGITTGLLSTRLSGHLRNPTNGKINLWFKDLKKYGIIKPLTNKYNIVIADIEKHLNNGLSQIDIAKIYNCGSKYINKIIKTKLNKNGK